MNSPLRIIYAGTPDFSVPALEALIDSEHEVVAVYTQPDRPAGRGRELKFPPVKETAVAHGIPVYQPESLRDEAAQQSLKSLHADLMVVTAYGLLLPRTVLEAPRLGCINIHASLLPRWRGAAPIQRALLAGDEKTGITIMQMDEGLDTGDILATAECAIGMDDTGASLHDRLMVLGAETLMRTLPAIAAGSLRPVPQDEAGACYAPKLSKAEARIDWTQPAVQIERAVRAFNAWPVAYTAFRRSGRHADKAVGLRIWQANVLSTQDADAPPGKVVAEAAAGIDVATGEGVLRITQVQPEGKRRMPVADFVNAVSLNGQILG